MTGSMGQAIQRVADIDAQLQWGGGGDIDGLPCSEFHILKMLRIERERLQQQQREQSA